MPAQKRPFSETSDDNNNHNHKKHVEMDAQGDDLVSSELDQQLRTPQDMKMLLVGHTPPPCVATGTSKNSRKTNYPNTHFLFRSFLFIRTKREGIYVVMCFFFCVCVDSDDDDDGEGPSSSTVKDEYVSVHFSSLFILLPLSVCHFYHSY